jgi:hypothetical protein
VHALAVADIQRRHSELTVDEARRKLVEVFYGVEAPHLNAASPPVEKSE